MKVLLVNYADTGGGASIATLRLVKALQEKGIAAYLGVAEKNTRYDWVIKLERNKKFSYRLTRKILQKFEMFLFDHFKTTNNILHSINLYSLLDIQKINNSDYDIIHLNWINENTLSIKDIAAITKPVVITLHDSWFFCGAEHHPNVLENDTRYMSSYIYKNKPQTTQGFDLCRFTYNRKKKYFGNKNYTIIAPSVFSKNLFKSSDLFYGKKSMVIPNIVDTNIFTHKNKQAIRELYGIPSNKKIIGFGAANNVNNRKSVKGGYYLIEALRILQNNKKQKFFLVVFGPAENNFAEELTIPVLFTGNISSPDILSTIYNACDVFVCSSLIESLCLTVLEAQSCGVPVTAFKTGGLTDIVEHKKTGYLAQCYEVNDIVQGIEYCLIHYEELSKNAFKKVRTHFSTNDIVQKHIDIYKDIISKNSI